MNMRNMPSLWRTNLPSGSDWNPFLEFGRLQRHLDRIMDGLNFDREWSLKSDFTPACDVQETDSHYLMAYDLPGIRKEDIKISLQGTELSISGERRSEREDKNADRYLAERSYGSFRRSFILPSGVKPEDIETEYKDGVLRVAVPKSEASKPHAIKIGEGRPGFWDRYQSQKKEELKKLGEKAA